ncbi:DUF6263 family protein [Niabella insulamsoli]|uniref:DUF6263 family protein n=1 Tax=Niabella insulamsoli TaxID=3144874 RepID=UPI0031FD4403
MQRHILLYYFIACLLLGASVASAQKTYQLSFKPQSGNKYDVVTSVVSKVAQNVMGQDMNIDLKYNIDMLYEISNKGAHKNLRMTYERLNMDMDAMGQKVRMDSDDPDTTNDASKSFRALKGETVEVVLDAKGKVIEVNGQDKIIAKAGGDAIQKQTLEGVLGEDALKNMLNQAFGFYPEHPVKVGDSWTDSMTLKVPYAIQAVNTYTLSKVEGNRGFIKSVSKLITGADSKITSYGIEMSLDLNGVFEGTSEIDLESGMFIHTEGRQNLKGNIEVQGQKIPMATATDISITATKK